MEHPRGIPGDYATSRDFCFSLFDELTWERRVRVLGCRRELGFVVFSELIREYRGGEDRLC